ncbi:MAG TPA: exodeoxyribonuclease VII large subunit, partial [Phycisphaerae bacterium]
ELPCVMWRSDSARLKFKPADGLEVLATGAIEVFERAGRYQLYVRRLEPRGLGALELAFRQMRDKLAKAGLFDPEHKKPLPRFPRRIAVITSPTGAVIRDILQTLQRRHPCLEVCVCAVRVQGPGAAEEIARAIHLVNARAAGLGGIDAMIVGRGGGSLEDLWAFNEEVVARAIFASAIPIVSAVGHEVDVTIADLVADVRAATPTAAAELIAPDCAEVRAELADHALKLRRAMVHRTQVLSGRLHGVLQRSLFREPALLIRRREQILDEGSARLGHAVSQRTHQFARRLSRCELDLARIEPRQLLLRRAQRLAQTSQRLAWIMSARLLAAERRLVGLEQRLQAHRPGQRLPLLAERLARVRQRLHVASTHRVQLASGSMRGLQGRLEALSYKGTLQRGYSITRRKKDRSVLRDPAATTDGDIIVTETAVGELESRVINRRQPELFE